MRDHPIGGYSKHRDGTKSIRLSQEQWKIVWRLIREGRKSLVEDAARQGETFEHSGFALDFMRLTER